jgi:D-alanyl-D-alanine carboxypeptidase/D-alanyl-D-alanine-endopeptidase (penicillin-binding protein 4)
LYWGRYAIAATLLAGCGAHAAPRLNPTAERQLASDLNRIFTAPVMSQGLWGVEVRSLDSGRVLYALNERKLMMPASNMKIVTLAVAAETLGWDYRFTTRLETTGTVDGGTLHGDLIVRGGGDPSINTRDGRATRVLDDWAAALRSAGITRIDGNVVGDDNAFDDEALGGGWAWDYLQYGYAAPIGALEYNEDVAPLGIRPGAAPGDPPFVDLPAGTGLHVLNRAVTGTIGSSDTLDYSLQAHGAELELTGSLAVDAKPVSREIAVVNPTVYFAQSLRDGLIARGIEITGPALDGDEVPAMAAPDARRLLAASQSPPLKDIAIVMMKVSQNLYAETLLKAAGAAKGGLGTTEGGRVTARAVLGGWGIPETTYIQVDGSGLSRYDYVTADMVVAILTRMWRDPRHHDAFVATLPIAGRDGTIRSRLKNTRAEGNALAKTGSIANVRTLSGFVKTRDGETLAFSILANSFNIPAATVNWIADLAVETLSNVSALSPPQSR